MNEKNKQRWRCWLPAILWVVSIYATLYVIRIIYTCLEMFVSIPLLVNGLLLVLFGMILFFFLRELSAKNVQHFILFFMVLALYGLGMYGLKIPAERVHFIEYGFLSYLIFRALLLDVPRFWAFVFAFVLTSLIGWGDEGIQYLLPNRYYEFRDVLLNSGSGFLGLLLTYSLGKKTSKASVY